jgi:rhamnose utilization protein RhaD (predicted bifunctional aldolase and dehydrogenase)
MKSNEQMLAELAEFSAILGKDINLVQGAGGNTSLKLDGSLWIKASGKWLSHARDEAVFTAVPLDILRTALAGESQFDMSSLPLDASGLRPSIETSLHALMPHNVVAHVHSVNAIAWAVRKDAEESLGRVLQGINWQWIPYRRPGCWEITAWSSARKILSAPWFC